MKQQSANATSIREHNLSLVLNLCRQAGSLSRSDIIRATNLSPTAVSALVNVLIDTGFVHEAGVGVSRGGRRPVLLQFDYGCRMVVGIDIGASHITVIAMDLQARILASEYCRHSVIPDPEGSLALVRSMVQKVLDNAGLPREKLLGMGITIPTPLDGEKLDRLMVYYMPAWEGIRPAEVLQQEFHVPTYLDNDSNAGAIAEKWWGSGKDYHSLAFIKLGVGVGGGLIIDGEIYRGFNGAAGEIGHTTIEASGRRCRCGNRGCMESYVGAPGLIADVVTLREQNGLPPVPPDELNVEWIVRAALQGDAICRDVIVHAGRYLGVAIANLINLVNPGLVVLGGDLVQAGDLLFDSVKKTISERVLPLRAGQAPLIPSRLGDQVVAIGAATTAIQNAFQPERLYATLGLVERR